MNEQIPDRPDEDNPEWTDADFRAAREASNLLPPDAVAALTRKRGRPTKSSAERKQPISIRLSREVIDHFREAGPGWQTRVDDVLREHVRRRGRRA